MPPEPRPPPAGPLLIGLGVFVVLVGLLVWSGALSWFGKLPGDIRYESGSTRIYVPWVSMLLISVVLSAVSFVARKLW
jgi:hypothetical protein